MKIIDKIKRWSIERKRIFAISLALFLTILIIVLNFGFKLFWKDNTPNIFDKNGPINSITNSFSKLWSNIESVKKIVASGTMQIIDQINLASSSISTTSNIVE